MYRDPEKIINLDNLAADPEETEQDSQPLTQFEQSRQILLRLGFTLIAVLYFSLHALPPLLLSRPLVPFVGFLFFGAFLFLHRFSKNRRPDATLFRISYVLDVMGGHLAWLCDPWDPAPMMLCILVAAVGNGASQVGFRTFRNLFRATALAAPVIYLIRTALVGFNPAALIFFMIGGFILLYIYILINHIASLQNQAEKKTKDLTYANRRLKKTGKALQDSESRYRGMFEQSGTATVLIEENMLITLVNSKFEELTGYLKNELCNNKQLTEFIHPEDLSRIKRFQHRRRAMGGNAPTEYECRIIDKHQKIKHVIIRISVIPWHERIIATLVDITSRKQARAALQKYNIRLQEVARKLQESELRYRSLFENTGTATILVEKNLRVAMANSKFSELTGYPKEMITGGKRLTDFIERKSLYRIRRYHARRKAKGLPLPDDYECLILDRGKALKYVVMKIYTPPGQDSSIVSFFDITSRKVAEAALQQAHEKLRTLAISDELTQVANRRRFDECLSREWSRLMRDVLPISLIMCDVDCFKAYNDNYGHQMGDQCLRDIAGAIKTNIKRSVDVVARYGGEEFAVIMPNTEAEGAVKVAETIRMAVEQLQIPHKTSSVSPYITLSLGVASMIPTRNSQPENLVQEADNALYEAKRKGRNRSIMGGPVDIVQKKIREDNVIRIS